MTIKSPREIELEQAVVEAALRYWEVHLIDENVSRETEIHRALDALREFRAPKPPALLPCPFCGSNAKRVNGGRQEAIECSSGSCDARQSGYSKISAAEAWNTRVARPEVEKIEPTDEAIRKLALRFPAFDGHDCRWLIRAALSEFNSLAPVEWRSIETLKRQSGIMILAYEDGNQYAAEWLQETREDGYWKSHCGQYVTIPPEPTHWQPLSPAPTTSPAIVTGES